MATAAATGVIAYSLFLNDSEENKDLDMGEQRLFRGR